ncbi:serine/threonine-protein kinase [Jannaschia aquimarina]|uniref:non-specific serine/threonine protein kinase n=1 Tax=Jannaschia aquimarina TaxID=935700 RepID=A0A0D1EEG8_9RHOB|nr:serine/threonine-protein kinase [Jannaschia aquimarina]KIT15281.1 Serine/threonine-protein kinase PK-1 [Jannaschia aquimarina]SNT25419.1 Serine/threonine protein kinase [Jannaschia aquimarina]
MSIEDFELDEQEPRKDGDFADELPAGTQLLQGQYTIKSFLNAGGFGITYRAVDSLDRAIVIKECFPGAFCRRSRTIVQARSRAHQNEFSSIVRLFVQEAKSLAKLQHPNIVGVHQVFSENDTAYMALDFIEGRDLLEILEDPQTELPPERILSILRDILGAIGFVHEQGMLHRDISPDNILIQQDGTPVLIDFGAARQQAQKQSRVLSALRVVKDGYSPQEFYVTGAEQGPFSDLYALGASFYHLITGSTPPDSQARLSAKATGDADPYVPLAGNHPQYPTPVLQAIDRALEVLPRDRVQSAAEWLEAMDGKGAKRIAKGRVLSRIKSRPAPSPTAAAPANADTAPRNKLPLLAGVAGLALVAAGAGAFFVLGGSDEPGTPSEPVNTAFSTGKAEDVSAADPAEDAERAQAFQARVDAAAAAYVQPISAEAEGDPRSEELYQVVADGLAANAWTWRVTNALAAMHRPAIDPDRADPRTAGAETAYLAGEAAEAAWRRKIALASARMAPRAPENDPRTLRAEQDIQKQQNARQMFERRVARAGLDFIPPARADQEGDPRLSAAEQEVLAANIAEAAFDRRIALAATTHSGPTVPSVEGDPRTPDIEASIRETEAIVAQAAAPVRTWSVALPFYDLRIDAQGSAHILELEGQPVETRSQFEDLLRAIYTPGDATSLPIRIGMGRPGATSDQIIEQSIGLPVVHDVSIPGGPRFRTSFEDGAWVTRVAALPPNAEIGEGALQVGDQVTGHISSGTVFNSPDAIAQFLSTEIAQGTTRFGFAVQRDGNAWVVSMIHDATSEG